MPIDPPSAEPVSVKPPRWIGVGHALVAAQFALMAWLVVLGAQALQPWPAWPSLVAAALLAGAGGALGLAALAANRPGNFNIHPAPRAGGQLVAHGPYRWIRHPMYAAVLLLTAAAAVVAGSALAASAWGLLLAVLLTKATLEERWLSAHHEGYAAYCRRTRRLVPGVF
jgi:protein-S-isoprenylcysteine O-methyltransferase Ste14